MIEVSNLTILATVGYFYFTKLCNLCFAVSVALLMYIFA